MNPLLMKALIEGTAVLIGSIANTAAKKGLAIMLLLGAVVGMAWVNFSADNRHTVEVTALKSEVKDIRSELNQCNEARAALAIEVAKLKTRFELFTKSKK